MRTATPLLLALALLTAGGCRRAPRHLNRPNVVAVAANGDVLVSDLQNARVVRFDSRGAFLRSYGGRGIGHGELWRPWGIAELAGGEIVVVNHSLRTLDDPNSFRREVKVFRADGGELRAFAAQPPGDAVAGWPEDVATVPEGLVVADQERNALLFFDLQGRFLRSIHEIDGGPPLVNPGSPRLHEGTLWLSEYQAHRVRRITLDGRQLASFGTEGEAPGELMFPYGLAVARDGWVVVADLGNYRVQRFDDQGRYLDGFSPEPSGPDARPQIMDVDVGADGLLYVVDSKGSRVLVCRTTGEVVRVISGWE